MNSSADHALLDPAASRRNTVGRPFKYWSYLICLKDDVVYCPASIVDHGVLMGLFTAPAERAQGERRRIRVTLARLAKEYKFPPEGDGLVHMRGQQPLRGWYGSRWKSVREVRQERHQKRHQNRKRRTVASRPRGLPIPLAALWTKIPESA